MCNEQEVAEVLVVTGLERANSPAMIKLVDVLIKRYIEVPTSPADEDEEMVDQERTVRKDLPQNFTLVWVRDEVASDLPGWMVSDHTWTHTTRS